MAIQWSLTLLTFLRDIFRCTLSFRSQDNIQSWKYCKSFCPHSIYQNSVTGSLLPAQGVWGIIWLYAQKEVKIRIMNYKANYKTCYLCGVRKLNFNIWTFYYKTFIYICKFKFMVILVSFFFQQNLDTPFLSKLQLHRLIFNRARSITAIRNTILLIWQVYT